MYIFPFFFYYTLLYKLKYTRFCIVIAVLCVWELFAYQKR